MRSELGSVFSSNLSQKVELGSVLGFCKSSRNNGRRTTATTRRDFLNYHPPSSRGYITPFIGLVWVVAKRGALADLVACPSEPRQSPRPRDPHEVPTPRIRQSAPPHPGSTAPETHGAEQPTARNKIHRPNGNHLPDHHVAKLDRLEPFRRAVVVRRTIRRTYDVVACCNLPVSHHDGTSSGCVSPPACDAPNNISDDSMGDATADRDRRTDRSGCNPQKPLCRRPALREKEQHLGRLDERRNGRSGCNPQKPLCRRTFWRE